MALREFQQNIQDMTAMQNAAPISALRSAFGSSHLPEEQVSFIHKLARINDNLELLGQNSGSIDSRIERGAKLVRSISEASEAVKAKAKRTFDTVMLLTMLDDHLAKLQRRIGEIEGYFEAKYGDAWAEKLAMEMLDPDEMPQKRDGESQTEYLDRVKEVWIAKVTDENGDIKPEYANHPDREKIEELAKTRIEEARTSSQIEIERDPTIPKAEKEASRDQFLAASNIESRAEYQDQFEVGSVQAEAAKEAIDDTNDQTMLATTVSASDNDFLMSG